MRIDLKGRRALVTGGGRGLGLEIAAALAEAGADVAINGRDAARLAVRASAFRGRGLNVQSAPFDVVDERKRAQWFARNAPVDILVNNATIRDRRATPDLPLERVRELVEVNALAAYAMTQLAIPGMLERGGGVVVNMVSIAGRLAGPSDPGYTLAKGALEALTRAQAVELGGQGIRVNGVAPGFFATEANQHLVGDPDTDEFVDLRVPMKRWGEPPEIAGAVVFLCSDAASYINGHVLVVDGGMSVKM